MAPTSQNSTLEQLIQKLNSAAESFGLLLPARSSSSSMSTYHRRQHVQRQHVQRQWDHHPHPSDHVADKVKFVKPDSTSKQGHRQPSSLKDRPPKKSQNHKLSKNSRPVIRRSLRLVVAPGSTSRRSAKVVNCSAFGSTSVSKKSEGPPTTDGRTDAKPDSSNGPSKSIVKKPLLPRDEPAGTSTDKSNNTSTTSTKEVLPRSWSKVQLLDKKFLTHLSELHPTRALCELCTKLSWPRPKLKWAFECGPKISRMYIFKAVVNGSKYLPTVAVNNRNEAKTNAAWYALQEMGFVNKDMANPL